MPRLRKGGAALTALLALLAAAAMGSCRRHGACLTPRPGEETPPLRPAPSPPAAAPAPKPTAKTNPLAGCQLCHVDVEDEYVTSRHFRKNVACVKCHGPSRKHAADENNEVKPDEIFAREHVEVLCGKCHGCSRKIPPAWLRFLRGSRRVCTECHAAHGFARRAGNADGRDGRSTSVAITATTAE